MIYNAKREPATPHAHGECPICGAELIAKCGQIVTWHWAHKVNECDPWSEPESDWHRSTKLMFQSAGYAIEVVMDNHRADIVSPTGHIIELQNNYQRPDIIAEREKFYGPDMSWLYRCHWGNNLEQTGYHQNTFRWMHPGKSILTHRRPVMWEVAEWDVQSRGYVQNVRRVRLGVAKFGDIVGQWGMSLDRSEAPDRWVELIDEPPDPLCPPYVRASVARKLAEMQRVRLAAIREGKWPRDSLEEWAEVWRRPYKWANITVRHANEIRALLSEVKGEVR